jgi:hypothetical protein
MPSTTSWRLGKPKATKEGYSSLSTTLCRLSAWPITARPASAASTASTHQPTAWGWIDAVTAAAAVA